MRHCVGCGELQCGGAGHDQSASDARATIGCDGVRLVQRLHCVAVVASERAAVQHHFQLAVYEGRGALTAVDA